MSSAALSVPPQQPARAQGRGPFARFLGCRENLLRLERTLDPSVARALGEVAEGPVFEHRVTLDAERIDPTELLEPVSNPLARQFLAQDVAVLARGFGAALGRRHLRGQLVVLAHDACRKFHTDNVTVRLLCTYAGPGTQWIRDEDAVRENLGRIDVDLHTANRSVLRVANAVRQCNTGDVLLLKGEAFAGNHGLGVVHRSPPIAERSLRRLVFKIDERGCGC